MSRFPRTPGMLPRYRFFDGQLCQRQSSVDCLKRLVLLSWKFRYFKDGIAARIPVLLQRRSNSRGRTPAVLARPTLVGRPHQPGDRRFHDGESAASAIFWAIRNHSKKLSTPTNFTHDTMLSPNYSYAAQSNFPAPRGWRRPITKQPYRFPPGKATNTIHFTAPTTLPGVDENAPKLPPQQQKK